MKKVLSIVVVFIVVLFFGCKIEKEDESNIIAGEISDGIIDIKDFSIDDISVEWREFLPDWPTAYAFPFREETTSMTLKSLIITDGV